MKKLFLLAIFCLSFLQNFAQSKQLPYYTGFDNPAEKAGWLVYRTGFLSSYNWGFGGGAGQGNISHDYNVGGNPTDTVIDWFISPPINFTYASTVSLKISTGGFSTPTTENLQVLFGTKNQDPTNSNFTVIATLSKLSKQYAWIDTSFSVSSISDSGYLAFRYITIGAAWATYTIDSITISEKPNGIINPATPVKLSISPNPTTNNCVVSTTSNCVNAAINLYDFSGKCVHQISNANGNLFNLQLADLANGIYIIEIIQEKNKIATGKFEICH